MSSDSVKICQGALVCEDRVELTGDITIGARTLIHPNVRIKADAGPIIIGENNIIEEQTVIVNRLPDLDANPDSNQVLMIIGDNNVFEVGSYCEALKVGDYNVLETKCKVGREVTLTNGCMIGAKCEVFTNEVLPENIVIFGADNQRRIASDRPQSQVAQLDFLSKLLPGFQKFKKPNIK